MPGFSDFRVPDASASEDTKGGWAREIVSDGEQWLKQQRQYKSINASYDLILNPEQGPLPVDMSRVRVPRAKRQIRELVSILSSLKPTASNRTENAKYYDQAVLYNQIDSYWWYTTFADMQFREGFQTTALTGTGYISHVWDPDFWGPGRGDIRTDVYGAMDVLLIMPTRNHDLQDCYAVVFKQRVPLWKVAQKWPLRAPELVPEHGSKGWTQKGTDYVQSFMTSPLRVLSGFGDEKEHPDDIFPTIDLYDIYIQDASVNLTGRDVKMGKPGTSWEYTVPAFGSDIQTGMNNQMGLPNFRKATIEDARLYPLRRRMVATGDGKILDDGSSQWWHGKVPGTRFRFDDWAFNALGFPLANDVAAIEQDSTSIMRGISDMVQVALAPPMVADENMVSERLAQRFNPRQPRQMLRLNLQMGDALKNVLPVNYANLPNYIMEFLKYENESQDFIIGVRDLLSMAKAKQIPSADSIEKMIQLAGPIAEDMTRGMERGMRDLGEFRRMYNMQFRSLQMRIPILGEKAGTAEDFDWDPGTLVPSHMEGENPEQGSSRFSFMQRALDHARKFYYYVVPHSISRRENLQRQLVLLQLAKAGVLQIDRWTMAEMFEIDNYGKPPDEAITIEERLREQKLMDARDEALAQSVGGQQPQPGQRGRPPTNQKPPRVVNKSGGTRSTIATSR